MTRWLSDEEQAFWRLWLATTSQLDRAIEDDLLTSGLTPADYEILAHLSEAPEGRLRMTELANEILVNKSRLTYRIDHLEARGLVTRRACTGDARGVEAVLTRTGRRAIERAAPSHVETVREALIDHLRPATRRMLARDLAGLLTARDQHAHGSHLADHR